MDSSAYILSLADRCVKCGLCLPQCPTYNLAANENESPRGRIALIQGWLTGQLQPSATLTDHLEQCLLCRRCERVCPSQVPYGEIMDQSKILLAKQLPTRFTLSAFIINNSLKILLNKKLSPVLISTLRLTQKTGLFFIAQKSSLLNLFGLQRLSSYLPRLDKPVKTNAFYPASKSTIFKHNIALFTGCLSKQLEPKTVTASINLLNRLGYGVYVPEQQVCCGALHLHEGNLTQAVKFATTNIEVFNKQPEVSSIISLVNGCTSQLREYAKLKTNTSFTHEVKDIIEFLAGIDWPEEVKFKPLNKTIAVQVPCSLQNILRAENKLMALLNKIPGLNVPPSAIHNKCCGASGSYFLRHPDISDNLQAVALQQLEQVHPELIVSSNLGCALQLKAGLAQKQFSIDVIHPVVLLASQINTG
jgi:glycolate oxidase iron-sulfur subunit